MKLKKCYPAVAVGIVAVLALAGCSSSSSGTAGSQSAGGTAGSKSAGGTAGSGAQSPKVDSLGLPSSSKASCSVAGKKMVYVSVLRENPVLQIMAQGAIDGAKAAGFESEQWLAPQGFDEPGAANLGNQAIAQQIDGIVVFATSPAFYPMIAKAKAAGIPVIQAHSQITEGDAPGVLANLYPDPTAYGKAAAEAIGKELKSAGKTGSVAITQTSFIPNENAAAKSFASTMASEFPEQKVLAPVAEGGDASKAIAAETSIVQAHSDLVAAFGTDGNGPVTWATTQRDTGKKITIVAMDYAKANLDLVKSGEVFGIVAQPLYQEHYLASMTLAQAICKDKVTYDQPLPAPVVNKAEVDTYYSLLQKVNIR